MIEKNKIIIYVGTDGVGKTTACENTKKNYESIWEVKSKRSVQTIEDLKEDVKWAKNSAYNRILIYDRFVPICSQANPEPMKWDLEPHEYDEWFELLNNLTDVEVQIVVLHDYSNRVTERLMKRGDELMKTHPPIDLLNRTIQVQSNYKSLMKIYRDRYINIWFKFTKIDWNWTVGKDEPIKKCSRKGGE